MLTESSVLSCGVLEAFQLSSSPKADLLSIYEDIYTEGPAFVLFSDISQRYGDKLRNYIHKQKLGRVTTIGPKTNTNSSNLIKVYVWSVDMDNFINWEAAARK